jgi:DNA-directed RNA polymerase subunit RPC12/RpoP
MNDDSKCRMQAVTFAYKCSACDKWSLFYLDQIDSQCRHCGKERLRHFETIDPAIVLERIRNGLEKATI